MRAFDEVAGVAVAGTGIYGGGLARHLTPEGLLVVDVNRPNRRARRRRNSRQGRPRPRGDSSAEDLAPSLSFQKRLENDRSISQSCPNETESPSLLNS